MSYTSFHSLLEDYSGRGFYFIQVGANDGITDDDIRVHVVGQQWRGILIEPLPDVFEQLRANYSGFDRLQFANLAITSATGPVEFWRHPKLPQCSGLGVKTR